jgi:hypothetical protein
MDRTNIEETEAATPELPQNTNDIAYLPLTQGQYAIIDAEDFERLSKYKWYAKWMPDIRSFYAQRTQWIPSTGKQRAIYLHRQIMGVVDAGRHIHVDHASHDTLDNRRQNLRLVDNRENQGNRSGKTTGRYSSKYTGVCWQKSSKRWGAFIRVNRKLHYLGLFATQELAAAQYKLALECIKTGQPLPKTPKQLAKQAKQEANHAKVLGLFVAINLLGGASHE